MSLTANVAMQLFVPSMNDLLVDSREPNAYERARDIARRRQ
jgi:hypothetical protein